MQAAVTDVSVQSGRLLLGSVPSGMAQEQTSPTVVTGVVCIAVELGFNPE